MILIGPTHLSTQFYVEDSVSSGKPIRPAYSYNSFIGQLVGGPSDYGT